MGNLSDFEAPLFSDMAGSLIGSEVLKIAGEIRKLKSEGKEILNFTVGDFDPRFFPIPEALRVEIQKALAAGETNYPPSSGLDVLREAVAGFYNRHLGVQTKASEILVAGGARPLIYTIFRSLVNPGDQVVIPVPSWNNNHYAHLCGASPTYLECEASDGFSPKVDKLVPLLKNARLLCLNTPLNPTGTTLNPKDLKKILEVIVSINEDRKKLTQRPLYLMYDQIYWKLQLLEGIKHPTPHSLFPAVAPYTLYVDGLSKYFCGTGLRVGWAWIPEKLIGVHSSVLGHVGAWAPKAEQLATAKFLQMDSEIESFQVKTVSEISARLQPLYAGISELKRQGLPVDVIEPQGGIYMSLRILPKAGETNEDIRKSLLAHAGIAVVPFQAFGLMKDSGWSRLSIGALARDEIPKALDRLAKFLAARA